MPYAVCTLLRARLPPHSLFPRLTPFPFIGSVVPFCLPSSFSIPRTAMDSFMPFCVVLVAIPLWLGFPDFALAVLTAIRACSLTATLQQGEGGGRDHIKKTWSLGEGDRQKEGTTVAWTLQTARRRYHQDLWVVTIDAAPALHGPATCA